MSTINDVAKKAGVGTSTVSRVLNNSPKVSDETKKKIIDAIKELNYYPSNSARGLASNLKYAIGLIMDNTIEKAYANPFIYETFRGVEKSVYEKGFNLILLGKNTIQNGKLAIENVLASGMIDGLILPSSFIMSKDFYKVKDYKIPIVSLGKLKHIDWISDVDVDNYSSGYKATEYLFSRGYKKIGFMGIELDKIFAEDRYMGYIDFLKENNLERIEVDDALEKIDAVICLDNIYAYKLFQICKKNNKKIGEEIGIITFDDYPFAEYLEPKITNVDVDLFKMGLEAGREIIRKIEEGNNGIKNIRIPVKIIDRESTR